MNQRGLEKYKLQLSENKKELDLFKSNIYKLTDDDIVNANGNHLIAITTNDNEAPRSSDEKMTTDELGSNIQGALEISSALKKAHESFLNIQKKFNDAEEEASKLRLKNATLSSQLESLKRQYENVSSSLTNVKSENLNLKLTTTI